MADTPLCVRPAAATDVPAILGFIRELAEYEQLSHAVVASEDLLRRHLFGDGAESGRPAAECLIGEVGGIAQGFALYFTSFSTFLARPGIYLEDLYVRPAARGKGLGKALFTHLAALAVERGCGRLEWAVLDWNEPAIGFYRRRRAGHERVDGFSARGGGAGAGWGRRQGMTLLPCCAMNAIDSGVALPPLNVLLPGNQGTGSVQACEIFMAPTWPSK
jgi:GNAT superfamily N-acetyltransferase